MLNSSISLVKGGNVSLSKDNVQLKKVTVGLGWKSQEYTGAEFDLDASAFGVGSNDKCLTSQWFIFYNQLNSIDGTIKHLGDNQTGGSGKFDDEQIFVNLAELPQSIKKVVFVVTIHDAEARRQRFGQVDNAYIRIVDYDTEQEFARFELTDVMSTETAMCFGEIYRVGADWKFKAVGQGYKEGLIGFCNKFGINANN